MYIQPIDATRARIQAGEVLTLQKNILVPEAFKSLITEGMYTMIGVGQSRVAVV